MQDEEATSESMSFNAGKSSLKLLRSLGRLLFLVLCSFTFRKMLVLDNFTLRHVPPLTFDLCGRDS